MQSSPSRAVALFRMLGKRLRGRPDTEHEQALVRLAITVVFLLYLAVAAKLGEPSSRELLPALTVVAVEAIVGISLVAVIIRWPQISHGRRVVGMLADYGVICALMYLLGEVTAPLYIMLM